MLYKTERKCHVIDTAVPGDKRIGLKEQEKVDNYSYQEVKKIWNLSQIVLVPVVIGTLAVTSKRLVEEELYRAFAKSSIAWNCKSCKASPRDLRLLGATCSLENLPELPTKPR